MAADALGGGIQLLAANVFGAVQDLPLQVGQIDDIEVNDAQCAHARRRQIQRHRRAQAARPDAQHARLLQLELTLHADLGQDEVAGVAQGLIVRKRGGWCSGLFSCRHGCQRCRQDHKDSLRKHTSCGPCRQPIGIKRGMPIC